MSSKRRRSDPEAEFHVYAPDVPVPRDVTHVLVPASVEVLPESAFSQCRHLKEVVLLAGLRAIGRSAFRDCPLLVSVDVPTTLVEIGEKSFFNCTSLREFVFPEGLTRIGHHSFRGCSSLVLLRLPSTLAVIPFCAFSQCSSLTNVTLPIGIREIANRAFGGCASLQDEVVLPATVTSIGPCAFEGCRTLKVLKLSCRVQRILVDAFYDCDMLDHLRTTSKALRAFSADGANYDFQLATDGDTPVSDDPHVLISSECFNSMSSTLMSEFQLEVTEILGHAREWDNFLLGETWAGKSQRLHALVARCELRHKREVTTLLELALWKSKMMTDGVNLDIRECCRLRCGASVIVVGVLPFL